MTEPSPGVAILPMGSAGTPTAASSPGSPETTHMKRHWQRYGDIDKQIARIVKELATSPMSSPSRRLHLEQQLSELQEARQAKALRTSKLPVLTPQEKQKRKRQASQRHKAKFAEIDAQIRATKRKLERAIGTTSEASVALELEEVQRKRESMKTKQSGRRPKQHKCMTPGGVNSYYSFGSPIAQSPMARVAWAQACSQPAPWALASPASTLSYVPTPYSSRPSAQTPIAQRVLMPSTPRGGMDVWANTAVPRLQMPPTPSRAVWATLSPSTPIASNRQTEAVVPGSSGDVIKLKSPHSSPSSGGTTAGTATATPSRRAQRKDNNPVDATTSPRVSLYPKVFHTPIRSPPANESRADALRITTGTTGIAATTTMSTASSWMNTSGSTMTTHVQLPTAVAARAPGPWSHSQYRSPHPASSLPQSNAASYSAQLDVSSISATTQALHAAHDAWGGLLAPSTPRMHPQHPIIGSGDNWPRYSPPRALAFGADHSSFTGSSVLPGHSSTVGISIHNSFPPTVQAAPCNSGASGTNTSTYSSAHSTTTPSRPLMHWPVQELRDMAPPPVMAAPAKTNGRSAISTTSATTSTTTNETSLRTANSKDTPRPGRSTPDAGALPKPTASGQPSFVPAAAMSSQSGEQRAATDPGSAMMGMPAGHFAGSVDMDDMSVDFELLRAGDSDGEGEGHRTRLRSSAGSRSRQGGVRMGSPRQDCFVDVVGDLDSCGALQDLRAAVFQRTASASPPSSLGDQPYGRVAGYRSRQHRLSASPPLFAPLDGSFSMQSQLWTSSPSSHPTTSNNKQAAQNQPLRAQLPTANSSPLRPTELAEAVAIPLKNDTHTDGLGETSVTSGGGGLGLDISTYSFGDVRLGLSQFSGRGSLFQSMCSPASRTGPGRQDGRDGGDGGEHRDRGGDDSRLHAEGSPTNLLDISALSGDLSWLRSPEVAAGSFSGGRGLSEDRWYIASPASGTSSGTHSQRRQARNGSRAQQSVSPCMGIGLKQFSPSYAGGGRKSGADGGREEDGARSSRSMTTSPAMGTHSSVGTSSGESLECAGSSVSTHDQPIAAACSVSSSPHPIHRLRKSGTVLRRSSRKSGTTAISPDEKRNADLVLMSQALLRDVSASPPPSDARSAWRGLSMSPTER